MLKTFLPNFLITSIVVLISLSALMGMEEEIPHYVDDEISVVDIGDEALEHAEDETSEHKEFHPGKYTEAFLYAVITNKCETFQCQWVNIGGKITQRTINAGVIPVYSSLGTTYIGGPRIEITRSSDDYICLFCKRRWYQGVHSFAPKVKIQQDGKNRVMVIYDKWLQSGSMCAKPRITDQELAFLWETTEGGLDWYIRLKRMWKIARRLDEECAKGVEKDQISIPLYGLDNMYEDDIVENRPCCCSIECCCTIQ